MKFYSKTILSLSMVTLIVGCGSSDSTSRAIGFNDSDKNSTTAIEDKIRLSGVAVDDLIVNGLVKAYSATTPKKDLNVTGRTDENGAYTLNLDYTGVVILEVTCDKDSKMRDPLAKESEKLKACEDDLLLKSATVLSPDVSKEGLKVNISPVSDLVVKQMGVRADGEDATADDLEASQDNIGQIFGFDPLGDSPVENENYKKTVSSIRSLADKKDMTMNQILDEIHEDLADGKAGDDGEISHELSDEMKKNDVKNTFTDNDGKVEPKDSVVAPIPSPTPLPSATVTPLPSATATPLPSETPEPIFVPDPTPTPLSKDIAVSKAFFDDLRTQTMSVIDYDDTGKAGFLDTESEALGRAIDNIALNTDLVAEYSAGIVGLITKSVDEGLDSKKIDIEDDENGDNNFQKTTNRVTRTLEVTKSQDPKVWDYVIEENTSVTYRGKVTLPDANVSSITASNFTTLTAKFDGKLPLRDINSTQSAGEQSVKLDFVATKSASGADLELKEVSIVNGSENVAIKTLKATVEYEHDVETDEVTMKSVTLDTITLKATVDNYLIDGTLDVDYITNTSISGNGFEKEIENLETNVYGQIRCAGEHNEYLTIKDRGGNVVYTDKDLVEYSISINQRGNFHKQFNGNLQHLAEGERVEDSRDYYINDNNYSNYLGLSFDNISVSSDSCSNLILRNVHIDAFENGDQNITRVGINVFCVNSNGERRGISNIKGTFTDKRGVVHTLDGGENNFAVFYAGNSEEIIFDGGHEKFGTFDRIAISNVNSECNSPILDYVNIGFSPTFEDKTKLYTYINGEIKCADESRPTKATVIYTDKSGTKHSLVYERGRFHQNYNQRIKGNVEKLAVTRGDKSYYAIGHILSPSMFTVHGSSCPKPIFERYSINTYSNTEGELYNSGVLPKKVKFVGVIKNTTTNGEVDAELNVELKNAEDMNLSDGADYEAKLKVTLKGKIKMPERPEMIINLGYENNSDSNDYSLSYQYNTTVLNARGTLVDDENGTIEFTGTSGIKLLVKMENGDPLYGAQSPVSRNGRKIGELQDRDGAPVIKYSDGSFESLP